MICGHLPKKDLKSLRLTCKINEQAASPSLFYEVFMSFNIDDLRIAKLVILRFGPYIRTLTFSSIHYKEPDMEEFEDDEAENLDYDPDHGAFFFQQYCDIYKTQQETIMNGSASAHLAFALSTIPNLRKILLADWSSSRNMTVSSLQRYGSQWVRSCTVADCSESSHFFEFRNLQQSGFLQSDLLNPWKTMLVSLLATNARVPEITMEAEHENQGLSFDTSVFQLPPSQLRDVTHYFEALSRLRLMLEARPSFAKDGRPCYVHPKLITVLSAATNLECLYLEIDAAWENNHHVTSSIQAILGECCFPKLRSLILAFFQSTAGDLMRVLKQSPKLEHLAISGHCMTSGSWAGIVHDLRRTLPLKSVHLDQLYGGFPEPWADTEFMDYFGEVDKFFLHGGKNPFTPEALEKFDADMTSGRERLNQRLEDSYIKRYYEYHSRNFA